MRIRLRRTLLSLLIAILVGGAVGLYIFLNLKSFAHYTNKPWHPVTKCRNTEQEMEQLLNLTFQVHQILDSLEIEHWLVYGSIWGAMRVQAPLPWDNDVDLGFHGEGKFSEYTIEQVIAPFKAKGLSVNNKWFHSGTLTVSKNNWPLTVDMFAFYNNNGWMQRRGLESWIAWLNYRTHHTYPAWVVELPLPKSRFGFFNISVPRGGIAIMKYLYRDNWWKEVKPQICEDEDRRKTTEILHNDFRKFSERNAKNLKAMLADEEKELAELFVTDSGNRKVLRNKPLKSS